MWTTYHDNATVTIPKGFANNLAKEKIGSNCMQFVVFSI